MLKFLFFCFIAFGAVGITAKERRAVVDKKKYNLSVCAILNQNLKHIHEWIEYHLLVGVDHFYLYSNGGADFAKQALKSFVKKGIVTLVPWSEKNPISDGPNGFMWALSTQIPAYENAIYVRGASETKWLVCLDLNEYLVPPQTDKITEVLEKYNDYSGLILSCDCFDSSKARARIGSALVIENVDLVSPPQGNPNREVKKCIFKPALCKGFSWPPYNCKFKDGCEVVNVKRAELRLNRYVYEGRLYLENSKRKMYIDNRTLSDGQVFDLLKEGYEIEDQEKAIEKFLPELRKRMGI